MNRLITLINALPGTVRSTSSLLAQLVKVYKYVTTINKCKLGWVSESGCCEDTTERVMGGGAIRVTHSPTPHHCPLYQLGEEGKWESLTPPNPTSLPPVPTRRGMAVRVTYSPNPISLPLVPTRRGMAVRVTYSPNPISLPLVPTRRGMAVRVTYSPNPISLPLVPARRGMVVRITHPHHPLYMLVTTPYTNDEGAVRALTSLWPGPAMWVTQSPNTRHIFT